MKKHTLITMATILTLMTAALTACASPDAGSGNTVMSQTALASEGTAATAAADTVTVNATASAFVVPDKARINVGTRTRARTATEAQEESANKTNAVIEAMKARGIEEKNISTDSYNMWQYYDNNGNPAGYEVSVSIQLKDQLIDEVGELIAALAEAGADQFHGISFYSSGYEDAYNEAMERAITLAKEKAAVYAAAAGKSLGEVRVLVEGYQDMTYADTRTYGIAKEEAAAMDSGSMNIEPGEAEISARVTVTYRMQ